MYRLHLHPHQYNYLMKINTVTAAIGLGISALMAYGFYSFNDNALKGLLALGSFILLALTLIVAIGVSYSQYATTVNVRTASVFFFVAALASNIVFSFTNFSAPAYIVTHGIMLLLYILTVYLVVKTRI
jgi:hypothetical protein